MAPPGLLRVPPRPPTWRASDRESPAAARWEELLLPALAPGASQTIAEPPTAGIEPRGSPAADPAQRLPRFVGAPARGERWPVRIPRAKSDTGPRRFSSA